MAKARSQLKALLTAARRVLTLQVLLSVFAAALAGWTLAVTTTLLRERDRMRERVIQLEEALASENIIVPAPLASVQTRPGYPPALGRPANAASSFADLIAPAPPLRLLVVHVRAPEERDAATLLATQLGRQNGIAETHVAIMVSEPRPSGYYYFDGRQSAAAAALAARFNDAAREAGLAPWSAQLRATALPARGEYGAERVDIVLPALPVVAAP
jgi:hypothetical protein